MLGCFTELCDVAIINTGFWQVYTLELSVSGTTNLRFVDLSIWFLFCIEKYNVNSCMLAPESDTPSFAWCLCTVIC